MAFFGSCVWLKLFLNRSSLPPGNWLRDKSQANNLCTDQGKKQEGKELRTRRRYCYYAVTMDTDPKSVKYKATLGWPLDIAHLVNNLMKWKTDVCGCHQLMHSETHFRWVGAAPLHFHARSKFLSAPNSSKTIRLQRCKNIHGRKVECENESILI